MKLVNGNRITLLKNGAEFFPALEAAIDAAMSDIRLETYIFVEDTSGTRIANALIRAASRGVRVQALIDGFGSRATPTEFFGRMQAAGVALTLFQPVRTVFDYRRKRVRRLHRKIVLVDGHIGFVGGINMIDDFNQSLSPAHPRYDYVVKIEGPVLADVYISVQHLWHKVQWFSRKRRAPHVLPHPALAANASEDSEAGEAGEAALAFVTRDNFRHRRDIERAYLQAITTAKKEILLVCPYFFPGRKLRNALMHAAKRGVTVTVLLQGVADHPFLQWATRAFYDRLLGAGIAIHEYHQAMLHGKVAVIDGHWATVGSSNLDPFSLLHNREANIVAHDVPFARALRTSVMDEIAQNAVQLSLARWQQRGVWLRFKSWLAFGFARFVIGLMGGNFD